MSKAKDWAKKQTLACMTEKECILILIIIIKLYNIWVERKGPPEHMIWLKFENLREYLEERFLLADW